MLFRICNHGAAPPSFQQRTFIKAISSLILPPVWLNCSAAGLMITYADSLLDLLPIHPSVQHKCVLCHRPFPAGD
ncbi:hypothetical protein N657DRAFT_146849 [Parathielavia appendiculata]|uniref:Uncharacterized protein n=1 Tax=Parathielavia appendiculata TaxID=2587402 RepID=A0AAN6TUG8_9PEZI|nr:hypothetical protein N657DRAFT_146849 [Parathielavia appendiculata]